MLKRLLVLLLCISIVFSFAACADSVETEETTAPPPPETTAPLGEAATYISVIEDGKALVPIVTSARASTTVLSAATSLFKEIYAKTGVYLNSDYAHEGEKTYEILIGDTSRAESTALKATLSEYEFAIKVTETKLVIVGYDDMALAEGIAYFISTVLADPELVTLDSKLFRLNIGYDYHSDGNDCSGFWEMLSASDTLVAQKTEELFTMKAPNPTNWPQGGCIKDGYYYQAFILKDSANNEKNNTVMIAKYEIETGKFIKSSNSLPLNHCNDITYNSKRGCFVVCHNNPYRTKVSLLDPDSLKVIETIDIGNSIYSIDYNASRDCYVVGFSGGQTFGVLNSEFKPVSGPFDPTTRTKGYTTQGVTSDDRYIYFVLYKENVITVYDWDGNFVTLIELAVGSVEPESIAIVRNEIYVLCGASGKGILYKLSTFYPKP